MIELLFGQPVIFKQSVIRNLISLIRKHLQTRNNNILSNAYRRNHIKLTGINKIFG